VKTHHLERLIQSGLLLLLALMPFHAFLSVWLGSLTGHQTIIQAWKEVLLAVLSLLALVLVIRQPARLAILKQPWVLAAGVFALIAGLVTIANPVSPLVVIYGLKTDFEFLVAAVLAALVVSRLFIRRALIVVLAGGGIVGLFAILQLSVLPPDFLRLFGYGEGTIEPYQYLLGNYEGSLRFPATLGGPNQLGTYLILPLVLGLAYFLSRRKMSGLVVAILSLVGIAASYSRGAWLGAATALVIMSLGITPAAWRKRLVLGFGMLVILTLAAIPSLLAPGSPGREAIVSSPLISHERGSYSDSAHLLSLQNGTQYVMERPAGHGLGTAGPATFRSGDATHIIESWYLQIGYETGLAGLLAYLGIIAGLCYALFCHRTYRPAARATAAAVLGVSVTAIVLPSWADTTTALVTWTLAGALAGLHTIERVTKTEHV
jgi:hypothetical protein